MPIYNDYGNGTHETMATSEVEFINTKLDAINLLMRSIGVQGVDSLDSGDLDAEDANKMIDVVSQRFQYNKGGGWWFNQERNWELAPDTNGEVLLPNNCLAVLQCYGMGERKIPMTSRAGKLYSVWSHNFDMRQYVNANGKIRLTLVQLLPFEHLPTGIMQAIAYAASVEFITSKDADSKKLQVATRIAQQMWTDVQVEQSMQKRTNMFVHNPTQRNFAAWAGGFNNLPGYVTQPYGSGVPGRPYRED